jgi:hypothetical protein
VANPFPANFEGLDGSRRLTGQVNFTDPANQPGSGGSSVIGTSVLAADGAAQTNIGAGFSSANISYTLVTLLGTDLAIDGGDPTFINVLTAGWYQIVAHLGINGTAPTSMKLQVNLSPAPSLTGHGFYDNYVGADAVNVDGCDLMVTSPVVRLAAGSTISVGSASDGTGTWNIEVAPNSLLVVRMA